LDDFLDKQAFNKVNTEIVYRIAWIRPAAVINRTNRDNTKNENIIGKIISHAVDINSSYFNLHNVERIKEVVDSIKTKGRGCSGKQNMIM